MLAVLEGMSYKFPDVVPRLYQPYFFDTQCEHADKDEKTIFRPLLSNEEGGLSVRVSRNLIYQGYRLVGEGIDGKSGVVLQAFFDC